MNLHVFDEALQTFEILPEKVIMGIPCYGQSFTLRNSSDNSLNAETTGPGKPGQFSRQSKNITLRKICIDEIIHKVLGRS